MRERGLEDEEIRAVADTEVLEWMDNAPEAYFGEEVYLEGFSELSTERHYAGQGFIGPIPVSKIREWAGRHGWDADIVDASIAIIRRLDVLYQDWVTEEAKKKSQKRKPG